MFCLMKWVQLSPGRYRFVEDDDDRPAVKLKRQEGAPRIAFTPSWKKYEAGMQHPSDKKQQEATDKFLAAREHEMKVDSKARRWEEGRKQAWAKNKPSWRKEMMRKGEI